MVATYLGIHTEDARAATGPATRPRELDEDKKHLAAIECSTRPALDRGAIRARPGAPQPPPGRFPDGRHPDWERRPTALDLTGDGCFLLFARDFAPLAERLGRSPSPEAVPRFSTTTDPTGRAAGRLWQGSRSSPPASCRRSSTRSSPRATNLPPPSAGGSRAADGARKAIAGYGEWLQSSLAGGTDDWALGRERYDELVGLRAFDGLDSDAILEIGHQQLAENKAARIAAAREIDPKADEPAVIDRIKSDHPATFEKALEAYRVAMLRRASTSSTGTSSRSRRAKGSTWSRRPITSATSSRSLRTSSRRSSTGIRPGSTS